MEIEFTINGINYKVTPSTVPIETSLNTFIRSYAHLSGTKFMCLEGGCGACIVTAKGIHPVSKEKETWAINSCLVSVFSCHGLDILTVEGIGNRKDGYHPVQQRLAHLNGTQCGYCSPGMVMNMYSLVESKRAGLTMADVENSFGGNMCRCTGYRPILDAFKSLTVNASEELMMQCKDIEDLDKICPKSGNPCGGWCHLPKSTEAIHLTFNDDNKKEWHKVYNIAELTDILSKIGKRPYILVAGNTAHGVYRRNPKLEVFIDITAIEELRSHTIGNEITIGGNVSLTETMEILGKAASSKPEFEYCKELIHHIDLIANVPVRNIGTIAGNLSIKHQHNEFPSDIFLILETIGAKITILDTVASSSYLSYVPLMGYGAGTTSVMTILEYVALNMDKKVIMNVILPPLAKETFVFRSFKIMPRAQNAHAFVNAGFLFEFNNDKSKIQSARICFGGIDPKFTHANVTEKFLIGTNLYTNETLQDALKSLKAEIVPDWIEPDASPEYRMNLALALFYKFVIGTCPEGKVKPNIKSGGTILERTISSGTQVFDTYKDKWPLTEPVMKLEALIQCSGEAQYANDIPKQPGELWVAFVSATKVHAKIVKIDPSEALNIPGVQAFFSAADIPGKNSFTSTKLAYVVQDEEIFCSGEVLYNGQPVGIIVADTMAIANYATAFVEILYEKSNQKILPTLRTVRNSTETHRLLGNLPHANVVATSLGLNATHSISGRLEIGAQYHYTMETQTCVCIPCDDGIGMDVYASCQGTDTLQIAISESLNIPENSINMTVRRVGGGYGGKITRPALISCAAALACHKLNRPIRFVMTLESNMNVIGKRNACENDYRVDCDDNGKIQKLTNTFIEDFGSSLNDDVTAHTMVMFNNCYINSTWTVNGKSALTDAPSSTACRAPGSTEGIAMIENIMEHIAWKVGKKPEEVRLANMDDSHPMKKMLPEFLKSIDFEVRRTAIDTFNKSNRWKKRGIGICPMEYGIQYYGAMPSSVSIFHMDGSVAITHGGIEMGQGINTKVAQVAAHTLGIPLSLISVKPTTSLSAPNSAISGGSITSEAVSYATMKACEILLGRINTIRATMKNDATWSELTHECYNKDVELFAQYRYNHDQLKPYIVHGVSCAEVEVDILTGNLNVTRVDILEDTGESLSPSIDVGQVEGAFVMGLGYWLTENLIYNRENGELLTNRTWTYKPPGVKDIPIDFRVTFLQKSSNPFGVLRSKATGEPSLCMSICAIFALRYALNSSRRDAGIKDDEEFYHLGAPSTTETVFLTASNKLDQFIL